MKKYWYYAFSLLHGPSNKCGVIDSHHEKGLFPLMKIQAELQVKYKGRSPVISFWGEISEKDFHEFVKQQTKKS